MKTITRQEWVKKPRDYRMVKNGVRYVLSLEPGKGTCLVPVEVQGMPKLPTRIEALRKIVATNTRGRVDDRLIDLFTASAMVMVHDALKPENQAKFGELPLDMLIDFTWKNVQ